MNFPLFFATALIDWVTRILEDGEEQLDVSSDPWLLTCGSNDFALSSSSCVASSTLISLF